MTAKKILLEATEIENKIIEHRRKLHQNAEVGFDLNDTVSFVKHELENMGITAKDCGKAGVVANIGSKNNGEKVFLLRADMDALPISEDSGLEFSSKNSNMHACGHDMHTAMLLGAAQILKMHEKEIKGSIKLMFQPAEELLEGADDMIKAGVLDNPKVDAAFMIHVMTGINFNAGTAIISSPGVSAPGADFFDIEVQGKGCHGSSPNMGIDALNAAAHILIALQEIHARELAMSEQAALTIGKMSGGTAANVIADTAVLSGSLRSFSEETRAFIKRRTEEIAQLTASTFRATAKVNFTSGCPSLINDKSLYQCVNMYVSELLGNERVLCSGSLGNSTVSGSEDFAYVSQQVPSIMLALAAGNSDEGYGHPLHHPKVKFDESALAVGSAIYAYTAMRWLEEH